MSKHVALSPSADDTAQSPPSGRRRRTASGVALLLLGFSGLTCSERNVIAVDVAEVHVQPATFDLLVGDTTQLSASLRDADGNLLSGRSVQWSTADAGIATVDGSGRVVAKAPGNARITANVGGVLGDASATIMPAGSIAVQSTDLVFTAERGGNSIPSRDVSIRSTGSGTLDGLSTSTTYQSGEPTGWLTAALDATSAPTTLHVRADAGTMETGVYHATLTVSSDAARPRSVPIDVLLEVRNALPAIRLDSTSLSFVASEKGADPAAQTVAVTNSGSGTLSALGTAVHYGAGQPIGWLTANVSPTTAPSTLTLSARTGTLSAGHYDATVDVVSGVASNNPQRIDVAFDISADPPVISLSRTDVTVSAPAGGFDPGNSEIQITNSGSGALDSLTRTVKFAQGQPTGWLTTTLSSTSAPSTLTLVPKVGTLAAGTYQATIDVAGKAANSPQSIAVTFIVTPSTRLPALSLSPATLSFAAMAGGPDPAAQSVDVTNNGGGILAGLTSSITYGTGQPTGWLSAKLSATTSPAKLDVGAATGSLAAGTYTATIDVSAPGVPNSPQSVTVTFVVASPVQPPAISLSTASSSFNATAGGGNAAAKSVGITNSGGGTLGGLAVSVSYGGGQPTGWLSATLGGTTAPTSVQLQPTTGSLATGTYTASVGVTSAAASNSPQTISVTFIVAPPAPQPSIGLSATTASFSATAGGPDPALQTIAITNTGSGTLNGLGLTVTYATGQPTGWINLMLLSTVAPATLRIQPSTGSLAPGTYAVNVGITSSVANNSPRTVTVTFDVTAPPVPAAPSGLTASQKKNQVDLSWKDNSNNEQSFVVQRSLVPIGLWTVVDTLPANSKSYRDQSTPPTGLVFWYRILACNAGGCSSSAVVPAT
jgi:Bacterial Ig-like domain (group 2)